MNCSKCGQPLDPGAVFCGNCGQPVGAAAPAPVPGGTPVSPPNPAVPMPPAPPVPPTPAMGPVAPGAPVPPPVPGQPSQPGQPVVSAPVAAPVAVGGGPNLPAYATAPAGNKPGEVKAIIGLVIGVLSIPGAFVPIVALVLGIAGVVLGSLSVRLHKKLAVATFILASIGIILGILGWIYNVQHLNPQHHLSKQTQTVTTDCYTVKLSSSLHVTNDSGACTTTAMDGSSTATSAILYHIAGSSEAVLNASNLDAASEKAAPTIVQNLSSSTRTYKLDSQHGGTFDGEQAHYFDVSAPDGTHGEIALVLHNSGNGDNVFELDAFAVKSNIDLSALASNWQWK